MGGDQPSQVQSTSSSDPWGAVQPYLKSLFARGDTAQQKASGANLNNGQPLSAPVNANQTMSQNSALDASGVLQNNVGKNLAALNTNLAANDVNNNPALANAITAAQTPVMNNFTRRVLPALASNAVDNAGTGSSRQGIAEGLATSDLNQTLANQAAGMTNEAYKTGLTASNQAMALAPSVYQSILTPSNITASVGAQQQQQQQQLLTDGLTRWNFDNNKDMNSLQQYAQLLRGGFGGTTVSSQPSQANQGGGIGGAVGGALTGFGATGNPLGAVIGGIGGLFS